MPRKSKMQNNLPVVPVHLDSSTAIKMTMGGLMFQERSLMCRLDVWHKITIIRGAKYDKEFVLKLILHAVEPAELIPIKYQLSGDDAAFIARNCGAALDKLCKTNLIIKNPQGDPLVLGITLGFASVHELKVNIYSLLLTTLTRRYNPNNKSLCLDNFHNDKELSKVVYYPLSQLRTFTHVLKVAMTALATFEHLNLQNNELFGLSAIESANLTTLKRLDLRNNKLMAMDTLTPLRRSAIMELWLDGNPLCENYSSPVQYIESAQRYCPNLMRLDSVYIGTPDLPLCYNRYLKNSNSAKLVNQFIEHYFALYDQKDRMILKGLYHENALYSVTLGINPDNSNRKFLNHFIMNDRNLLKITDAAKRYYLLYQGQDKILLALRRLPRTCHDRNSFSYDLLFETDTYLMISVEGVFKNINVEPQMFYFNRTFVLAAGDESEYNIINDQYHINFALPEGAEKNFEYKPYETELESACLSPREKEELVTSFQGLTTMNQDWCRTFLKEYNWDIRKAITMFMKIYSSSRMPVEAFRR
ncbi:nuclear RNA export factor 1 [Orussus abietinus]|uniref:nuclear RNA export factor 1 n=1 Tax=Orussus abietinus TaxID=222816 RepID=UPI000625AF88|nr:nuclear RNA export factor 1 [Orussus abietinus]